MKKNLIPYICIIFAGTPLIINASQLSPSHSRDTVISTKRRTAALKRRAEIQAKTPVCFSPWKPATPGKIKSTNFSRCKPLTPMTQKRTEPVADESLRESQEQAVLAAIKEINLRYTRRKPTPPINAYLAYDNLTLPQEVSVAKSIKIQSLSPLKYSESEPTISPAHQAEQKKRAILGNNNPRLKRDASPKSPTRVTFSSEAPIIIPHLLPATSQFVSAQQTVDTIFPTNPGLHQ